MCSSERRPSVRRRLLGRGPVAFLLRLLIFAVIFVGVGEVWFRTVAPACEQPLYMQDSQWKIKRADPSGPVQGLFTVGRLTARGGAWRVNNDGWMSDINYVSSVQRNRPLVALLGDSQIEGFFTDADRHVDVYLAEDLNKAVDVYSFAGSGWDLEQYVAVSRYATGAYSPSMLVIFIGNKDVVDSVRDYGLFSAYLWQIKSAGDSFTEVGPASLYTTGRLTRPAKLSAVLNYLLYNAKVTLPGRGGAAIPQDLDTAAARSDGAPQSAGGPNLEQLTAAAQYMVDRLLAENAGVSMVFVANGDGYMSPAIDSRAALPIDVQAVQAAIKGKSGCYFLDLDSAFANDWAVKHLEFVAADKQHWNVHANQVVAAALAAFIRDHNLVV